MIFMVFIRIISFHFYRTFHQLLFIQVTKILILPQRVDDGLGSCSTAKHTIDH